MMLPLMATSSRGDARYRRTVDPKIITAQILYYLPTLHQMVRESFPSYPVYRIIRTYFQLFWVIIVDVHDANTWVYTSVINCLLHIDGTTPPTQ